MLLYEFIKEKRRVAGLTQPVLAEKAGVGLRFVRDLEQGKQTLRLDKVNQVLQLFGFELGPVEMSRNLVLRAEPGKFNLKGADLALKLKKKRK
ncbi:MAG: helix-turn-helix transcriptional regulator [Panacibacter sp.]